MNQNQTFEKLYYYDDGKVYLQLPNNTKLFYLGCIKSGVLYTDKKQKDVFRKNNSFAYNYQLIKNGDFNILHTTYEEKSHFYLSKAEVLKFGKLMQFKNKGQEKQIFVPLNSFHRSIEEAIKNVENKINFGNASMTTPYGFSTKDCTQISLFEKP